MNLSNLLRREKTIATAFQTVTFNAPGTYYPPYGKTAFLLQGQGTPGNAATGGTYANTNPSTGGTYANTNPSTGGTAANTNPSTGGTYANTNPSTGGTVANTNPSTGGNYANTNPSTGGNYANTNPSTGGTYANTNPTTYVANVAGYSITETNTQYFNLYGDTYSDSRTYTGTGCPSSYTYNTGGNNGVYTTVSYSCAAANYNSTYVANVAGYSITQTYTQYFGLYGDTYSDSNTYTGTGCPSSYATNSGGANGVYATISYSCAVANYSPGTPGNANYNPVIPGNANYNPVVAGTSNYNPVVAGTTNYNPVVAGNANYNTVVAGNANYNPVVPGNAGASNSVLGVSLPGGAVGTAASVIGYVPVSIDYTAAGISITCPPGGYVKIQNL